MSIFNSSKKEKTEVSAIDIGKISSIKVLGSGCKNCHTLLENTKKAALNLGIKAEVEYITDMKLVMLYGVMSMPALAVNERVVSSGKVLSESDAEKLLRKLCNE